MSVKSDSSILINKNFQDNNLQLCGKDYSSNVNILNFTYHHASLPHSSYIDYFAVSESILNDIVDFDIIDSGVNLSDHNLINLTIDLGISFSRCRDTSVRKPPCPQKVSTLRWDHANLSNYYELSRSLVLPIYEQFCFIYNNVMVNDSNSSNQFFVVIDCTVILE